MIKSSISASIQVEDAEIAKVVLMPGDPLRAKYVAEHYLENPVCFNTVRNMLGYTGTYKGKKISVMGSGMGVPSMGIYATELYNQFDVDAIIRIGSAGGLGEDVKVRDVVIAMGASTNSSYGDAFGLPGYLVPMAEEGEYQVIQSTDDYCYGGHGRIAHQTYTATVQPDGRTGFQIYLPSRTAMVLKKKEAK